MSVERLRVFVAKQGPLSISFTSRSRLL